MCQAFLIVCRNVENCSIKVIQSGKSTHYMFKKIIILQNYTYIVFSYREDSSVSVEKLINSVSHQKYMFEAVRVYYTKTNQHIERIGWSWELCKYCELLSFIRTTNIAADDIRLLVECRLEIILFTVLSRNEVEGYIFLVSCLAHIIYIVTKATIIKFTVWRIKGHWENHFANWVLGEYDP